MILESNNQNCFLLLKPIYGLKSSFRLWYKRFKNLMLNIEFHRSGFDNYVHIKKDDIDHVKLYLLLCVDVILIVGAKKEILKLLREILRVSLNLRILVILEKSLALR